MQSFYRGGSRGQTHKNGTAGGGHTRMDQTLAIAYIGHRCTWPLKRQLSVRPPTCLLTVARQAQIDSFAALLAHKADVNAVTNVGKGVLHLAVQYGSIACADKCILQNVTVNTLVPDNPHTLTHTPSHTHPHTHTLTLTPSPSHPPAHCCHSVLSLSAVTHCALCGRSLRVL